MALTDFELTPTARRVLHVFLLVDISASMEGEKIAAVNDAIRNVVPILGSINDSNPDAEIKIAALTFSGNCQWMHPQPVLASQFEWDDKQAMDWTNMGAAVRELNTKLSHKQGFLQSASGSYAPVVIMLSDGAPTDDFPAAMGEIAANNWFRHAMRIAIAIGADADCKVLASFTGNAEMVFRVQNIDALKAVIKTAVVTSSMVASRSSSIGISTTPDNATSEIGIISKKQQFVDSMMEDLEGVEGLSVGDKAMLESMDFDEFD